MRGIRESAHKHLMSHRQPNTSSHSAHLLHVHIVFVIKYRRRVLTGLLLTELEEIFRRKLEDHGATLDEFNGEPDHVHLLITYPPALSVGDMARYLKGGSSFQLRKNHPHLRRYPHRAALWTAAYLAASAGGAPLAVIQRYIQDQARPN